MVRHLLLLVAVGCSSRLPDPEPQWPPPAIDQIRQIRGAPISLTASDGSGLRLERMEAKAVVEGPLAFTELHLYFRNDEDRQREGRFAIALPERAAVSRFAMQIGEQMQEAEVVPKQLARRTYEDFLHRKQDPALLEKSAGNEFTARVFPIPPRAEKHLVISFSQELVGEYVLPLRGLPSIGQLDVTLEVTRDDGTRVSRELHERGWLPDRDFTAGVIGPAAVGHGELVAVQLIQTPQQQPEIPRALTILVDTSASRALGFTRYIDSIGELVTTLVTRYGDLPIEVVAFDQDTQIIHSGTASRFGARHRELLLARGPGGASDLGQALARLPSHRRVAVISDGVITAGADRPALIEEVRRFERLDMVVTGGIRDTALATALARAGARPGDLHDLERGPSGVAIGLGERVRTDVPVAIEGASWSYPKTLPALRAGGDPLTVYARMGAVSPVVTAVIGGERRVLPIVPTSRVLLERAHANAGIDELEQQLAAGDSKELRAEIEQRSVAARVVSSQTAMLVLETEHDYERFRIPRTALADILVVRDGGVATAKRSEIVVAPLAPVEPEEPPLGPMRLEEGTMGKRDDGQAEGEVRLSSREQAIEQARSVGILGSTTLDGAGYAALRGNSGFGRSGFGPAGAAVKRPEVPMVSSGMPTTTGSLDKSIIRRYIRRSHAKIAYCYERELLARPQLAGTVVVEFAILSGKTSEVTARGVDPQVASCVAGVVRDIEFPSADGKVIVSYPFTFRVAGAVGTAAPEASPPPQPARTLTPALSGKLAVVMDLLAGKRVPGALAYATKWRDAEPGDVLAWIAMGEALEASHQVDAAARMYGSIIDLFPGRADLRRFAGERLERVATTTGTRRLAIDTYRRAVADRPDHATGHRLLAYALLRGGEHAEAFTAILAGIDREEAVSRRGVDRILREDAEMIATVYLGAGGARDKVEAELKRRGLTASTQPSTRFLLYWETDANDVDFHIRDASGEEAYYSNPRLRSGGELYADVTTGYGPECFTIPGKPAGGPYRLALHYYSQGPMGYGMGLLQIQRFDGKTLTFEDRPYVIMQDDAYVDLGSVR